MPLPSILKRFKHRRREPEWMDAPDASPTALLRSLGFIRRVNRLLLYTRSTVRHIDRISRSIPIDRPITILDVATGSADVPQALLHWAAKQGQDIQVIGLDLHERALLAARDYAGDPRIKLVRGDALRLPFDDASVDIVTTSMFMHHLDEPMAVQAIREMHRVARNGVVIADLLRSARAYAWISLFTIFSEPMVRHDARVSVAGAFTAEELMDLCKRAGIRATVPHRHFGHRLILSSQA